MFFAVKQTKREQRGRSRQVAFLSGPIFDFAPQKQLQKGSHTEPLGSNLHHGAEAQPLV
jgi:hypothetical protein